MIYKAEIWISDEDRVKLLESIGLKVELEEREFREETRYDVKCITQKVRVVRHRCNNEEYPGQEQIGYHVPYEWDLVERVINKLLSDRLRSLLMHVREGDVAGIEPKVGTE